MSGKDNKVKKCVSISYDIGTHIFDFFIYTKSLLNYSSRFPWVCDGIRDLVSLYSN